MEQTTVPTYTEEDLRDAMYAYFVDEDNQIQRSGITTDVGKVSFYESSITVIDLNDEEDWRDFKETFVPKQVMRYQRGKEILKTCKVLTSHRSTCLGDNLYDEMVEGETIVSPVIRIFSGYIAMNEAYRWCTLALRKGKEGRSNGLER